MKIAEITKLCKRVRAVKKQFDEGQSGGKKGAIDNSFEGRRSRCNRLIKNVKNVSAACQKLLCCATGVRILSARFVQCTILS